MKKKIKTNLALLKNRLFKLSETNVPDVKENIRYGNFISTS